MFKLTNFPDMFLETFFDNVLPNIFLVPFYLFYFQKKKIVLVLVNNEVNFGCLSPIHIVSTNVEWNRKL